jgi:ATP-dependent RNA helicase SUPV3L1/SUV3
LFVEGDGAFHFGEFDAHENCDSSSSAGSDPDDLSPSHISCTVEMMNLHRPVHTVVIDEIQMLSDEERGWAWTRALLGAPAENLHLCGSASALSIVKKILSECGEDIEVNEYDRLAPLRMTHLIPNRSDWPLTLRAGDCVIAFSRKRIMELKKDIERLWSGEMRCGVVYGKLPPLSRSHQAELFNDPNNDVDVLVASDAVGMGLNLNIRRIIFTSTSKFDGSQMRSLTDDEIKQIAGRAGRYQSLYQEGLVTAIDRRDHQRIRRALNSPPSDIHQIGIFPTFDHLEMCSEFLGSECDFADLVAFFEEKIQLHPDYFVCNCEGMKYISVLLSDVPLSFQDRFDSFQRLYVQLTIVFKISFFCCPC